MIDTAEDAIIARIQEIAGSALRECASVPANFDVKEIAARNRLTPAVYVAFLGGTPREENAFVLDGEFAVFFLTGGGMERQRRRGAPSGGAYTLMELVLPLLHGYVVPDIGTLTCTGVANLFADELDELGVSLYSATFKLPLVLEEDDPAAALADFLHFHADYIVPPHAEPAAPVTLPLASPDAADDVTLPSAS